MFKIYNDADMKNNYIIIAGSNVSRKYFEHENILDIKNAGNVMEYISKMYFMRLQIQLKFVWLYKNLFIWKHKIGIMVTGKLAPRFGLRKGKGT